MTVTPGRSRISGGVSRKYLASSWWPAVWGLGNADLTQENWLQPAKQKWEFIFLFTNLYNVVCIAGIYEYMHEQRLPFKLVASAVSNGISICACEWTIVDSKPQLSSDHSTTFFRGLRCIWKVLSLITQKGWVIQVYMVMPSIHICKSNLENQFTTTSSRWFEGTCFDQRGKPFGSQRMFRKFSLWPINEFMIGIHSVLRVFGVRTRKQALQPLWHLEVSGFCCLIGLRQWRNEGGPHRFLVQRRWR